MAGGTPEDAALLDLNGDALQDVVVSDPAAGLVRLLLNQAGSPVPFSFLPVGTAPRKVCLADLDRDGRDDLVVLDESLGTSVLWLPWQGYGIYGPVIQIGTLPGAPRDVVAADVTGDGAPDVLVATAGSTTVNVWNNDGAGSFGPSPNLIGGFLPVSRIAVAELDGDGVADVVLGHDVPARITLYRGRGGGFFGGGVWMQSPVSGGLTLVDLALVDLDGNGIAAVVALLAGNPGAPGTLVVQRNGLRFRGTTPPAVAVAPDPLALALADLDGDGAPDLVTAHAGGALQVSRNPGRGWFTRPEPVSGGIDAALLLAGEVSGDGVPDVVVMSPAGLLDLRANTSVQGGPLRPGSGDPLDLTVGVGTTPLTTNGPGVHVAPPGAQVTIRVDAWMGVIYSSPLVALALQPASMPPTPGPWPYVWLPPGALVLSDAPLNPIGSSSEMLTVPPGLAGLSAVVQAFVATEWSWNRAWAASDASELVF